MASTDGAATDWNELISAGQTRNFDGSDHLSSHTASLPPCEAMIMRPPFNNHNLTEMSSTVALSCGIQIPASDFSLTNIYTERNHKAKRRTVSECGGSLPHSDEHKHVSPESMKSTVKKRRSSELLPGLCSDKSTFKQAKETSQVDGGDSKEAFIHVRAKRGKATNSHSLAERVRREKISERMRVLQDLVPGCNKITGKAVMLDEIINYVQSLQQQVEFLTMKLATVNPEVNFDIDQIFSKAARDGNSAFVGYRTGPYGHYDGAGHIPSEMLIMAPSISQLSSMAQMKSAWEEELLQTTKTYGIDQN